ncbi:4'-phosphopantetheinyl transferase [Xylariomycetidae sp. FL0641]|nr:4'-phosphopantetheinyl transferase [Xylariomycetidae sp. FL0641]
MASDKVQVIQYLVDTRELWPAATKTAQLETEAIRALSLLTDDERAAVLRYYFVADAKMALASHLLKHWVVSRYCGVAWEDTRLTRDAHKKPIYVDASGRQPVAFNVSHQAGLVALVAVHGYGDGRTQQVDVGVDVVCTSERRARDHKVIAAEGWPKFVDMHADVFGSAEADYLKTDLLSTQPASTTTTPGSTSTSTAGSADGAGLARDTDIVDFKLRCFYTLWCLREAYVKMTGEALLAEWLNDLNFRHFRPPAPGRDFVQRPESETAQPSEAVKDHDVWFKGHKVDDANICLRSLGPDYMTCSAVRTPQKKEDALGWELGPFQFLDMDDLLSQAEEASTQPF